MAVDRLAAEHAANKYLRRFSKHFAKSPSPDSLKVNIRFPAELWLEILSYLQPPQVASVTLTCRALRALAQPFLFRRIVLRPFADSDLLDRAGALMTGNAAAYRSRFARRLDFFLTPAIASMVQELCIMPQSKQAKRPKPVDELVDQCFDALPRLVNLERLICTHLPLDAQRGRQLHKLPLKHLMLEHCYSAPIDVGTPLGSRAKVETLALTCSDRPSDDPALHIVARLLNPKALRALSAGPSIQVLPMLIVGRQFGHLRDLDLSASCVTSAIFVPALYQTPNLERLILRQAQPQQAAPRPIALLPPDVIPLLKAYSGPRRYVQNICATRPVQWLEITPTALPEKLTTCFNRLKDSLAACTIDTLSIRTQDVDADLFASIHATCIKLRHFTVKGCTPHTDDWTGLFQGLVNSCGTLRMLRIYMRLASDPYNDAFQWRPPEKQGKDIVRFFRDVHPGMVKVYPNLKKLQVSYNLAGACATLRKQSSRKRMTQTSGKDSRLTIGDYQVELGVWIEKDKL